MAILDDIRRFWDEDASTYDDAPGHRPTSAAVQAAWTAALEALLPPPPARVLDCGAGTGFLSLIAARLGHRVTALDLSPQMLARLRAAAEAEGLDIAVVVAPAHEPPDGFDAVMERHLLWTLPDPTAALTAWRAAAPHGRLVAIESMWGDADPVEALRARASGWVARRRGTPPDHHGPYPASVRGRLPLGSGTHPRAVAKAAADAGWTAPRLVRLRDVEWATVLEKRLPERLLGVTPRFAVVAT
ncbi:MAG: class I SAM-dependent methyltransferase [Acidimicrobiales bacterium]